MDKDNCNQPSKGCCCGACEDEQDLQDFCGCDGAKGMIMLSTEDGQELQCGIISVFGVSEMDYIALQPVNTNEVLIFRYIEDDDGTIDMDNIKSDEEFDRVSEAFKGLFEDDGLLFDEEFDEEE